MLTATKQVNGSAAAAADHHNNNYHGSNRENRSDNRGEGQGLGLGLGTKGDMGFDHLFVAFVESLLGSGLRVLRRLLFVLRLLGTHRRLRLGEKLPLGYARIPLKDAHKAAVCGLWKEIEHMILEQLLIHLGEKEVEAISDAQGQGPRQGLGQGLGSAKNNSSGGYSHQPSGDDRQRVVFGDLSGATTPPLSLFVCCDLLTWPLFFHRRTRLRRWQWEARCLLYRRPLLPPRRGAYLPLRGAPGSPGVQDDPPVQRVREVDHGRGGE